MALNQTRRVSLSESEGAPSIVVPVNHAQWNGLPIVLVSAGELRDHLQALRDNDPNGTWDEIEILEDPERGFIVRVDDDPDSDTFHEYGHAEAKAWMTGYVWNIIEETS